MTEMRGFWFDAAGRKLRRLYRSELAECRRLWARHADIRLAIDVTEPTAVSRASTCTTPIEGAPAMKGEQHDA